MRVSGYRSGGICRPDPVCSFCDCVLAAEAPRRAIPGAAVAAGLRALPGAGRSSASDGLEDLVLKLRAEVDGRTLRHTRGGGK